MMQAIHCHIHNQLAVSLLVVEWVLRQYWRRRPISWWALRQLNGHVPPGPVALPLIGHLHLLAGGAPHSSLAKLAHTYGPLLYIRLGSMPTIVVSSPDLAREVLSTHDRSFASRPHFSCCDHFKGSGGQDAGLALARHGPGWAELRKIAHAQLFTASRVKAELPIVREEIQRMMADVRRHAMAGMAYDITKGTGLLLDNIICRLVLGRRLEEVCDVRLGCSLKEKLMEGIALFSERPMIGDFIPCLGFLDILHKRRIDAWNAAVHAILHDVLASRSPLSPDHEPKDLLDSLLLAHKDPDAIKVILVDFLCGGIDTPSVTLDWAMAELLRHPKLMVKLEEELNKLVGDPSLTMVEEDHLPHLNYTKAVIKETLRLHAPVPLLIPHMAIRDCEVARYTVPQGTRVLVNVWAIGRDQKSWDKPLEFLPDRFLDRYEQVDVRGKHFELLPFGSGRRGCPGLPLSLPILEMALANLIRSFHWYLPPSSHGVVDMSEKLGSVLCRASSLMAIPTIKA